MKLTIRTEDLTKALAIVGKAVATRPTLPVLSHVLIQVDSEKATLLLAGTDLEQFIIQRLDSMAVEESGALTVPWKLFNDLTGTFVKDELVTLTAEEGEDILHVECGKSKSDLRGIDSKEFPMLPKVLETGEPIGLFSPDDLAERLAQVTFAAANDESRPILTGVYVQAIKGVLSFVTADGFRLAWRHDETDLADGSFVMPGKAADTLVGLLAAQIKAGHDLDVSLFIDSTRNAVHWRLYDVDLCSQLLEGNFVNYTQIVPTSRATRLVLDRRELERHLRTMMVFHVDIIHLDVTATEGHQEGTLCISAQDAETGEVESTMTVDMDGDPVLIAFNAKFLLDALNACGTAQVVMELSGSTRPGVVKPVDDEHYLGVIMPMHVRE